MASASLFGLWPGFKYLEHQIIGVQWMLDKERIGTAFADTRIFGGFQCDDMGLGKTIQILGTMRNNLQKNTLILCPLAMVQTWVEVAQRSGFNVFALEKGNWHCGTLRALRPNVYICNFDKILSMPDLFLGEHCAWNRIVLDEAHKIRSPYSEITMQICKISAPIRWAVTGTPIVNGLRDITSLLAFLGCPHDEHFRWDSGYRDLLPKILMHRSMNEMRSVLSSAPPVPTVERVLLEFDSEREKEFYSAVRGEISDRLASRYSRDFAEKLEMLLRMRQISVHPQVYINSKKRKNPDYDQESFKEPSTKFNALARIIKEEDLEEHKYLIFCSFREEMDLLKGFLKGFIDDGIEQYHGGLSKKERDEILDRAKSSSCKVLLIQLQSGGVGLNLQEFDRCIFMSPWWTAALMQQAIARTVRMGQTRVVRIVHLLHRFEDDSKSIDSLMNAAADRKAHLLKWLFDICNRAGVIPSKTAKIYKLRKPTNDEDPINV